MKMGSFDLLVGKVVALAGRDRLMARIWTGQRYTRRASGAARREVERSSSSDPGREMVQVETLIPAGVESGWRCSSGRRG